MNRRTGEIVPRVGDEPARLTAASPTGTHGKMINTALRCRRQVRQSTPWFCAVLSIGLLSCRPDRATGVDVGDTADWTSTLPLDTAVVVTTPTYERSGQAMHPDFAAAPAWWPNRGSYLAMTPYPGGDFSRENPSLLVSGDPVRWREITGGPTPIVFPKRGYLSDPDIVFNPEARELWMYYRYVGDENVIELVRSTDGRAWSAPEDVIHGANHTIVSPSVVRRGPNDWRMWVVNPGPAGCTSPGTRIDVRDSRNGREWTAPRRVTFPSPGPGYTPWHIEVQWIPSRQEYWAVFNAKTAGNCGTTALFLSTSADGETWATRSTPLLIAGDIAALSTIVYRTTFSYNAASDVITFWYSGAGTRDAKSGKLPWHTVVERRRREEVFARTGGRSIYSGQPIPPTIALPVPP